MNRVDLVGDHVAAVVEARPATPAAFLHAVVAHGYGVAEARLGWMNIGLTRQLSCSL